MTESEGDFGAVQPDLFSDVSDLDIARHLLADLHDGLQGRVARLRMLADIESDLGSCGTMIFGGRTAEYAWGEARSSFIYGNFVATVLLCQGLIENLLAAYLNLLPNLEIGNRVRIRQTLQICEDREVLSAEDTADIERLMNLRNPLSHFRHLNDPSRLDRRSMDSGQSAGELIRRDAVSAISLVVRILAKPGFRLDG